MPESRKSLPDPALLVSGTELAEIVGIDLETVDNWLRRGIISRASVGGRQLRSRLFSLDEVYRAALIKELVTLGLGPSSASEAVNVLWKKWDKKEALAGRNLFAVVLPSKDGWTVEICSRKGSGGPLYKLGKSTGTKLNYEVDLPKQTFAVIPISEVFDRVANKLSELLR